ncbi:hypothetical protein BC834DRAFT_843324 [Gloeopeniophorella convolvens]|nr:hypothetical protein BC834DRAFT_843324 [Gloeopeniophorella convolvens]
MAKLYLRLFLRRRIRALKLEWNCANDPVNHQPHAEILPLTAPSNTTAAAHKQPLNKHPRTKNRSPGTRLQNIPGLPLEIIDKILREACEFPLHVDDRRTLSACARVCKSWLPFVQELLYHTITIENTRAFTPRTPGTLGQAALLRRPHLLSSTRSLTVGVVDDSSTMVAAIPRPLCDDGALEQHQQCVRTSDFLELLTHTPKLRHLRLVAFFANETTYSFAPQTLDWLASLRLPISVLDLKYGRPFDSLLAYDLAGLWHALRALRVFTDYSNPLPERPNKMQLHELRLPITSAAAVVTWFLPPPPRGCEPTLRVLELYDLPEAARDLLAAHGHGVVSLTLTRQPAFDLADVFDALEELVVAGPFWNSPLPALPRTLRHVRLHVHAFVADVLPAFAAALSALPDLRVLSVEEALTKDARYPALRDACKARGWSFW